MLIDIIPDFVECEIIHQNIVNPEVHPIEKTLIQNASESRKIEFLNGRQCAHYALTKLGQNSTEAILIGKNREPIWPDNIVGSITHCDGYCAVAVAFSSNINCLGIDAELNTKFSDKLLSTTQTDNEITTNKELENRSSDICINKLVFSAKESFFKLIFPYIKCYLNFKDVEISVNMKLKTFSVLILNVDMVNKIKFSLLHGKFIYNSTHIVTCIHI